MANIESPDIQHPAFEEVSADSNQQLWLKRADGGWHRLDLAGFTEVNRLSVDDFLSARLGIDGRTIEWPGQTDTKLVAQPGLGTGINTPVGVEQIEVSATPRGWYRPLFDQLGRGNTELVDQRQVVNVLCRDWLMTQRELEILAASYPIAAATVYQRFSDLNMILTRRSAGTDRNEAGLLTSIHSPWAIGQRSNDARLVTPYSAIGHQRLALVESIYGFSSPSAGRYKHTSSAAK